MSKFASTPIPALTTAADSASLTLCSEADAPWSAADYQATHIARANYVDGIAPVERHQLPGYNSALMTLLVGVFLIIALNLRHYTTFLKTFTHNLFSVRRRANMFDDNQTTNEARVLISLLILLCLSEGILLYTAISREGFSINSFTGVGIFTAVAAAYYLFQTVAYSTVGYVFTTPRRAITWMKGFNASQALLGITLTLPAVAALFNPGLADELLGVAAVLYLIARLIFISKGFRIFYNNSLALIYFILYLCSLEIIPLIIIYKASVFAASLL
ncbi:MAG: DUF4271 domain-containing protein [Bacteroides sp.]|nr:DUF4271 domain-containing protein [Bacteroides sp.]MBD5422308.1 DUF4271 domain-containing protein [Bacteroides sp.]